MDRLKMEEIMLREIKERMDERDSGAKETTAQSVTPSTSIPRFDFSYFHLNSLNRNRTNTSANVIQFNALAEGEGAKPGIVGVARMPTEVVQIKLSDVEFSRKFETTPYIADEYFGIIYMLVREFQANSFISPLGFRYHFQIKLEQDPNDPTELIGEPIEHTYTFPNEVRFDSVLSFEINTSKPFELDEDTYECYVDYSGGFLRFREVSGEPHGLSNLDIVYLENFAVPGIYDVSNPTQLTNREYQYRISVVSATEFDIPIPVVPSVANSINRPADPALGVYRQNMTFEAAPGLLTTITSPIPHGLLNNDEVTVTSVEINALNAIINTWPVQVINATEFTVPFDSTAYGAEFTLEILALPRISNDRENTLIIRVVTKKIEFGFEIVSANEVADNGAIVVA